MAAARSNRLELFVAVSPKECVDRLDALVDRGGLMLPSWKIVFGSKRLIGQLSDTKLQLRKRIGYRNSSQTILNGTMRAQDGGTMISGEFGLHPVVRIFPFVWCVLLLSALAGFVILAPKKEGSDWALVMAPVLLMVLGMAVVWIGKYFARDEARFITATLTEALQRREEGKKPHVSS